MEAQLYTDCDWMSPTVPSGNKKSEGCIRAFMSPSAHSQCFFSHLNANFSAYKFELREINAEKSEIFEKKVRKTGNLVQKSKGFVT